MADGLNECGLVFFYGKAADIDNFQRALTVQIIGRHFCGADALVRNETVREYLQLGSEMVALKPLVYVLCGALNESTVIEYPVPP